VPVGRSGIRRRQIQRPSERVLRECLQRSVGRRGGEKLSGIFRDRREGKSRGEERLEELEKYNPREKFPGGWGGERGAPRRGKRGCITKDKGVGRRLHAVRSRRPCHLEIGEAQIEVEGKDANLEEGGGRTSL